LAAGIPPPLFFRRLGTIFDRIARTNGNFQEQSFD
jgi:hypothetical protein